MTFGYTQVHQSLYLRPNHVTCMKSTIMVNISSSQVGVINALHYRLQLKVLDQITLENKFCLNFKTTSVFIWVAHPKWKKTYRFVSCFEVVGENDAYVIYCFIECGYHTLLFFFVNTQVWTTKFQDVNEKNMSHLLVQKSQKLWGKLGVKKVIWSRTFNSHWLSDMINK